MTQSQLPSALKKTAESWATQIVRLARSLAPAHVRPAISWSVEAKEDGKFTIRITAYRQIAPDARAQEYGSGLRARRGTKSKYTIRAKNAPFLVFAGTNEYEGFLIKTEQVQHPGIEAANSGKGYIAPAVNEIRRRGRKDLEKDIREAILGDIRRSFGRK